MTAYEVRDVVCDYGVYENDELKLILNSRRIAEKIVELLKEDDRKDRELNSMPEKVKTENGYLECPECRKEGGGIMSEKERLIELIDDFGDDVALCDICDRPLADCEGCTREQLAEFLIENGVIVPPVKVGSIVWVIYNKCVMPANVLAVYVDKSGGMFDLKILTEGLKSIVNKDYTFDMVYTTKEQAEKALRGGAE